MSGEFGEVTAIIGLVINFLPFGTPLLSFRDTLSYSGRIFDIIKICSRKCLYLILSIVGEYSILNIVGKYLIFDIVGEYFILCIVVEYLI